MQTFDNTRPVVAAMGVGVARAALERAREVLKAHGYRAEYDRHVFATSAVEAELYRDGGRARGRALAHGEGRVDGGQRPAEQQRSVDGQGQGRPHRERGHAALRRACSALGYLENELLEKWARDSKILDIFEGTQQIQQLIIARRLLNKSSAELK